MDRCMAFIFVADLLADPGRKENQRIEEKI
jgi:hypothetical protein